MFLKLAEITRSGRLPLDRQNAIDAFINEV